MMHIKIGRETLNSSNKIPKKRRLLKQVCVMKQRCHAFYMFVSLTSSCNAVQRYFHAKRNEYSRLIRLISLSRSSSSCKSVMTHGMTFLCECKNISIADDSNSHIGVTHWQEKCIAEGEEGIQNERKCMRMERDRGIKLDKRARRKLLLSGTSEVSGAAC